MRVLSARIARFLRTNARFRAQLALAGAAASRPANSLLLTLPPVASRLWRGWPRVVAHALIPDASEEQDLGAAVARGQATATVRRLETDDIVHCGPHSRIGRSLWSSSMSK